MVLITHYVYLHGYKSSPLAKKGVMLTAEFKKNFGIDLICPDLNKPSFDKLTFSNALKALDEM
jgi:predicted esterase YcpF (UPF0227 family)